MRITTKLLSVFVLLLVTFSPQTSASAEASQYGRHDAWAYFSSTDASGCIGTGVEIDVGEDLLPSIALSRYDMCSGQGLLEAYGRKSLSKSEIKYIGDLDSATLTTTVHMTPNVGPSFDVFIDLTWIGTGDILINRNRDHYQPFPGCNVNVQLIEKYREAQASGTISDGTTNFTPEPSLNAYLDSWKRTVVESDGCQ